MSWLLFMDESGHDHVNMPLEVRGGVAIHAKNIWNFVCDFHQAEEDCYGLRLAEYRTEIKGCKLLTRKRWQQANQMDPLTASDRRKAVRRFLTKGLQKEPQNKREFTAYGQASIEMARRVFDLLQRHNAVLFASAIPRGVKKPRNYQFDDFLRKDHTFLQERFYNFLESKQEHGLFVMDQTDKTADKRYVRKLQNYYQKTRSGKERTRWIVPAPIFVDSEMSPGVQAADLCLYCVNWGFRRSEWNFSGPKRDDIANEFAGRCGALQYKGDVLNGDAVHKSFGIIYVPDPYTSRSNNA